MDNGVDDLQWDGCKLLVKQDTLYLIGRDQAGELAAVLDDGDMPARELGAEHNAIPGEQAAPDVQSTYTTDVAGEDAPGEAWIVIPKEQWAEFIHKISEGHEGWRVRVETEGSTSFDATPLEDTRFSGMQLEPSMARPGVRLFVGSLPEGFFEHVIPDMRSLEHLPSDEDGYQAVDEGTAAAHGGTIRGAAACTTMVSGTRSVATACSAAATGAGDDPAPARSRVQSSEVRA